MIQRIAVPGSRQPIWQKSGDGLLMSAGSKAARALKGPALQFLQQAGQKLLGKAKKIVDKKILNNKQNTNREKFKKILNNKRNVQNIIWT